MPERGQGAPAQPRTHTRHAKYDQAAQRRQETIALGERLAPERVEHDVDAALGGCGLNALAQCFGFIREGVLHALFSQKGMFTG